MDESKQAHTAGKRDAPVQQKAYPNIAGTRRTREPPIGFEPMTPSLPWKCSTTELRRRILSLSGAGAEPTSEIEPEPSNRTWSGRRDSNPRPSAWKADALPTELLPQSISDSESRIGDGVSEPPEPGINVETLKPIWWTGEDSNLRRRMPLDLQSSPVGHFGTCPSLQGRPRQRRARQALPLKTQPVRSAPGKQEFNVKSRRRDSNPQPAHYK